jgi:hypothetical protein
MDQRPEFDRPEITPEFDDGWRMWELDREISRVEAIPEPTPTDWKINRDRLESLESERKKILSKSLKSSPPAKHEGGSPREGGRPHSLLREAVEHLYGKLHESRDSECLRAGAIRLFMQKFRAMVGKDEYITERIVRISLSGGKWTIKTQEITAKEDSQRVVMQKSKTYGQNEISKILNDLRRKKPIE